MPYLTVCTNTEIKNGRELSENASALIANVLHKPVNYVAVNIIHNANMAFGGSYENKGVLLELQSIGLGDKNKVVAELTSFFARELNIMDTQYINIVLTDCSAAFIASGGQTFG